MPNKSSLTKSGRLVPLIVFLLMSFSPGWSQQYADIVLYGGNILTANPGAWINPVDVFEFQWLRNGNVIAGEITNTYELVLDDENHSISCRVTASNAGGDGEAESLAVLCTRSTFGQPWVHNGVDRVPAFAKVELS